MDLRKLKKLIDLVQESGIGEVTIEGLGKRSLPRPSPALHSPALHRPPPHNPMARC